MGGRSAYAIATDTWMAYVDDEIAEKDIEPLVNGTAEWHAGLDPAGDATVIVRDGAFANDAAKADLSTILEQCGFKKGQGPEQSDWAWVRLK